MQTTSVKPVLLPGDVFCTQGKGILSAMIGAIEYLQSPDNEATYRHSGVITSAAGDTLEALWQVEKGSLSRYKGQKVFIARPIGTLAGVAVSQEAIQVSLAFLEREHLGQGYPVWRLFLHLVRPFAKFIATGNHLVCAELDAKFLSMIGARYEPFTGVTPDMLADEWRRWKNFDDKIFEGVWAWD